MKKGGRDRDPLPASLSRPRYAMPVQGVAGARVPGVVAEPAPVLALAGTR